MDGFKAPQLPTHPYSPTSLPPSHHSDIVDISLAYLDTWIRNVWPEMLAVQFQMNVWSVYLCQADKQAKIWSAREALLFYRDVPGVCVKK